MSSPETTQVWVWSRVERRPGGPLVETAGWWKAEVARREQEGWRLTEQRPSSFEGCTVYVFTRGVPSA